MKRLFLLVLPLLFLLAPSLPGCVFHSSGPTGDAPSAGYSDSVARSNILAALGNRDSAAASCIEVFSFNRHVFLVGYAEKGLQSYALTAAQGERGVRQVTHHWFTEPARDKMANARLAANIESKLLFDSKITAVQMNVSVNNGNVVLTGIVPDKKTAEEVVSLARQVRGVKDVTSYLAY